MNKPTLLVLAAGIGSRYGGLKQMDQVGPSGEAIIDYSIYDAMQAGFGKIVFVIRKDIEKEFKEVFIDKLKDRIEVDYVFQHIDMVPKGVRFSSARKKPWGTGHAVLVAEQKINEPFAVINADDFYGSGSYRVMADFLTNSSDIHKYSMVGYRLDRTLSDHGYVARGVCETNKESYLKIVTERTRIEKENNKIIFIDEYGVKTGLTGSETVSMNFWGFNTSVFDYLNKHFIKFMTENSDNLKAEFFIPDMIADLIMKNTARVKVLNTDESWFGVTYREDKPVVIESIRELISKGVYPSRLW
jgi:UTP-glucose-1-phosphate uridylyltransferase